jgi:MtN3 and saliva related transmembrane protein
MQFELIEPKVSPTMNGFLILANIINLLYNIPQIVQTYKTKSTKDFNIWFIVLRIIGNFIWLVYALEVNSLLMLINYSVTVISSLFIGYYKWREYLEANMKFTYNGQLLLDDRVTENEQLITDQDVIEDEQLITDQELTEDEQIKEAEEVILTDHAVLVIKEDTF